MMISCPWITVVGATGLYNANPTTEVAAADESYEFYSGGGFSNLFNTSDYQTQAVSDYFTKYPPPYAYYESVNNNSFGAGGGVYNRKGRGYPDVSAIGDNINIYVYGYFEPSAGTSASTPIVASIVNRINEERLEAGKSPVGFLNYALYKNPTMLNDVVSGTNDGCSTNGFNASIG